MSFLTVEKNEASDHWERAAYPKPTSPLLPEKEGSIEVGGASAGGSLHPEPVEESQSELKTLGL